MSEPTNGKPTGMLRKVRVRWDAPAWVAQGIEDVARKSGERPGDVLAAALKNLCARSGRLAAIERATAIGRRPSGVQ